MKSVLLIGLGRFGKHIAIQLNKLGHEVLGIDTSEERVNDAMDIVTDAKIGDSTNEAFLRTLGVRNFDICYVTISNDFQSSLETTYLLKELGAGFIIARAERDMALEALFKNKGWEVTQEDIDKQLANDDDAEASLKALQDAHRVADLRKMCRQSKAARWLIETAEVEVVE